MKSEPVSGPFLIREDWFAEAGERQRKSGALAQTTGALAHAHHPIAGVSQSILVPVLTGLLFSATGSSF